MSITALRTAAVSAAQAGRSTPVRAFMNVTDTSAYVTTSKGYFEIAADSPRVKTQLAALRKAGTQQVLVTLEGTAKKGTAGLPPVFKTSSLTTSRTKVQTFPGVVKSGNQYFTRLNLPGKPSQSLLLKAGNKEVAERFEWASQARPSASGPARVTGVMNGKVFEVWEVSVPSRTGVVPTRPGRS